MEKMMIAFGAGGLTILAVVGDILGTWEDEDPDVFVDELGSWTVSDLGEKDSPQIGIWVWEGKPKEIYEEAEDGGPGEYDYTDFSDGKWRPPTRSELDAAVKGDNPWKR